MVNRRTLPLFALLLTAAAPSAWAKPMITLITVAPGPNLLYSDRVDFFQLFGHTAIAVDDVDAPSRNGVYEFGPLRPRDLFKDPLKGLRMAVDRQDREIPSRFVKTGVDAFQARYKSTPDLVTFDRLMLDDARAETLTLALETAAAQSATIKYDFFTQNAVTAARDVLFGTLSLDRNALAMEAGINPRAIAKHEVNYALSLHPGGISVIDGITTKTLTYLFEGPLIASGLETHPRTGADFENLIDGVEKQLAGIASMFDGIQTLSTRFHEYVTAKRLDAASTPYESLFAARRLKSALTHLGVVESTTPAKP